MPLDTIYSDELIQDNVKYLTFDGIAWFKTPVMPHRKSFTYYKCACGKLVSNSGWGYHQHKKKCDAKKVQA